MVQAISSAGSSITATGGAPGPVQAQLAEAERLLSDCVNCDTAKTAQGQAKIQVLSARVQALRARLSEAQGQGPATRPSPATQAASDPTGGVGGRLDLMS